MLQTLWTITHWRERVGTSHFQPCIINPFLTLKREETAANKWPFSCGHFCTSPSSASRVVETQANLTGLLKGSQLLHESHTTWQQLPGSLKPTCSPQPQPRILNLSQAPRWDLDLCNLLLQGGQVRPLRFVPLPSRSFRQKSQEWQVRTFVYFARSQQLQAPARWWTTAASAVTYIEFSGQVMHQKSFYCPCYHRPRWKLEQLYWSQHTFCYLCENIPNILSNKMRSQWSKLQRWNYAVIQDASLWNHPFLNEIDVNKLASSSGSPTGERNNI